MQRVAEHYRGERYDQLSQERRNVPELHEQIEAHNTESKRHQLAQIETPEAREPASFAAEHEKTVDDEGVDDRNCMRHQADNEVVNSSGDREIQRRECEITESRVVAPNNQEPKD